MSAQRYTDPRALERMAQDLCPECGSKSEAHSSDPHFWTRASFECDLLPRGVEDRIAQYKEDQKEN